MGYTAKEIERLEKQEQEDQARKLLQTLPRLLHFWILPGSTGRYKATDVKDEVISFDFVEEKGGFVTFGDVIYLGVGRVRGAVYNAPLPDYYRSAEAWERYNSSRAPAGAGGQSVGVRNGGALLSPDIVPERAPLTLDAMVTPGSFARTGIFDQIRQPAAPKPVPVDNPVNRILAKKDETIATQGKTIEVLKEAVTDLRGKVAPVPAPAPATPVRAATVAERAAAAKPTAPLVFPLTSEESAAVARTHQFVDRWMRAMGLSLDHCTEGMTRSEPARSNITPSGLWKVYMNFCKAENIAITDAGKVLFHKGTAYPMPTLPIQWSSYNRYLQQAEASSFSKFCARMF